jgi:hypothetical protein
VVEVDVSIPHRRWGAPPRRGASAFQRHQLATPFWGLPAASRPPNCLNAARE